MLHNTDFENTSQWLKHNSQQNKTYRYKQLEFDFGPSIYQVKTKSGGE